MDSVNVVLILLFCLFLVHAHTTHTHTTLYTHTGLLPAAGHTHTHTPHTLVHLVYTHLHTYHTHTHTHTFHGLHTFSYILVHTQVWVYYTHFTHTFTWVYFFTHTHTFGLYTQVIYSSHTTHTFWLVPLFGYCALRHTAHCRAHYTAPLLRDIAACAARTTHCCTPTAHTHWFTLHRLRAWLPPRSSTLPHHIRYTGLQVVGWLYTPPHTHTHTTTHPTLLTAHPHTHHTGFWFTLPHTRFAFARLHGFTALHYVYRIHTYMQVRSRVRSHAHAHALYFTRAVRYTHCRTLVHTGLPGSHTRWFTHTRTTHTATLWFGSHRPTHTHPHTRFPSRLPVYTVRTHTHTWTTPHTRFTLVYVWLRTRSTFTFVGCVWFTGALRGLLKRTFTLVCPAHPHGSRRTALCLYARCRFAGLDTHFTLPVPTHTHMVWFLHTPRFCLRSGLPHHVYTRVTAHTGSGCTVLLFLGCYMGLFCTGLHLPHPFTHYTFGSRLHTLLVWFTHHAFYTHHGLGLVLFTHFTTPYSYTGFHTFTPPHTTPHTHTQSFSLHTHTPHPHTHTRLLVVYNIYPVGLDVAVYLQDIARLRWLPVRACTVCTAGCKPCFDLHVHV